MPDPTPTTPTTAAEQAASLGLHALLGRIVDGLKGYATHFSDETALAVHAAFKDLMASLAPDFAKMVADVRSFCVDSLSAFSTSLNALSSRVSSAESQVGSMTGYGTAINMLTDRVAQLEAKLTATANAAPTNTTTAQS
jgi:hypothetical protein